MNPPSAKTAGISTRVLCLILFAVVVLLAGVLLTIAGSTFNSQIPTSGDYISLFAGGGLLVLGLLVLIWALKEWTRTRLRPIYSLFLVPIGILVAIWSLGLISTARFEQSRVAADARAARVLQELQYDLGSYIFAGPTRSERWDRIVTTQLAQLRELKSSLADNQAEVAQCLEEVEEILVEYDQLLRDDVFPIPGMAPDVERDVRAKRSELLTKINTTNTNLRSEMTVLSTSLAGRWQQLSFLALYSGILVLGLAAMGFLQLRETDRRRNAEQVLYQQERRLRMMLEQLPAIVWTTDRDLRFTTSDGAGLSSLSLNPGQVVGLTLYDFFQTDDREFKPIAAHVDALSGSTAEYQQEWDDKCFMTYVGPLRDEDGGISGTIGAAWDITALRQAEVALRQRERLAALGTMAAGIAHEINNPLWMISLQAEAASLANQQTSNGSTSKTEAIGDALKNIRDLVLRGGKIVSNILKFSGKTSGEQISGQLMEPIVCAVELSRKRAQQAGVSIELDAPAELPMAQFNSTEIEQVIVNLLNNAIDASDEGGSVSVHCDHDENDITITIADRGAGMSEESLMQMFHPFFTTRRKDGGTGLGLAICDRIIKDHSGQIHADSEIGQGTRLTVTLPCESSTTYANTGS